MNVCDVLPEHDGVALRAITVRRSNGAGVPSYHLPLERLVAGDVEPARPHEPALPRREAAAGEPLEGRLRGGAHEEGVAGHEVERRDVEADGLHDVPRELPEGEPHEPQRLRRQEAQPAPQLPPHLRRRRHVDGRLLLLHRLQLPPLPRVDVDIDGAACCCSRRLCRRNHAPDRSRYHVGAEEDGVADDDDDAGVVERPGEPAASLGAASNVDAERGEFRPGHDALGVGPQPRPSDLHLRSPRHLPRLLHRHAHPLLRRPRYGRRRDEPVEAEPVEQLVANGEGREAMGRSRNGRRSIPDSPRSGPQVGERRAVVHRRQRAPRRGNTRRSFCRSSRGTSRGVRVLACPYAPC
uniref:Uncharacterized protein n=1 Tax=Oryza brachyantha TaxID=4533 RepID=J3LLP3_ORYBR